MTERYSHLAPDKVRAVVSVLEGGEEMGPNFTHVKLKPRRGGQGSEVSD
jgi:hypothetical protein